MVATANTFIQCVVAFMQAPAQTTTRKAGRKRFWRWAGIISLIFLATAVVAVRYVIAHAEPVLRARVIDTLSTRFKSKSRTLRFSSLSLLHGIEVSGTGPESLWFERR